MAHGSNTSHAKENGGRDEYDFDDGASRPGRPPSSGPTPGRLGGGSHNNPKKLTTFVDGTVDSALSSVNNSPITNEQIVTNQPTVKVAKLKIKI